MAQILQRLTRGQTAPPAADERPRQPPFAYMIQLALWLPAIIDLHERGYPHPLGHRARRPAGRRATPAVGLRRAAPAGGREIGPGEAWSNAAGHGLGPRGVPPAGGRGAGAALG